jgi:hypothetical protein
MRRASVVCVLLLSRAHVSLAEPPAAEGTLVVRVTAKESAQPIEGAVVKAWSESRTWAAATDAAGVARIAGIPEGEVDLRADATRWIGEEDSAEVEAGKEVQVVLALGPGVPFSGRVVSLETGRPLADVEVVVQASRTPGDVAPHHRQPYARERTGADGGFTVGGVPERETATVEASADGYATTTADVTVRDGKATPDPVTIRLEPGGEIRGVVRDPEGRSVSDALVFVFPTTMTGLLSNPRRTTLTQSGEGDEVPFVVSTDANGGYLARRLPLDVEYAAVAEADGFSRSKIVRGLNLTREARLATADLGLLAPATLIVRLVDPEGRPVTEDALVQLGGDVPADRKRRPDAGNAYHFRVAVAGELSVLVEAPSFRRSWSKAVVAEGTSVEHVVRLDPGAAIEGVVVDEAGKPVAGALVSGHVVDGDDPSPDGWTSVSILGDKWTESDAEGRFALRGLPPGDVRVSASSGGGTKGRQQSHAITVHAPAEGVRVVVVRQASVAFRLVSPDGRPYEDDQITVTWWRRGDFDSLDVSYLPGEGGRFVIDALEEGPLEIQIDTGKHVPVLRSFVAAARTCVDFGDVALDPGIPVRGRVTDAKGDPVAGTIVLATPADGGDIWLASTGLQGGSGGNGARSTEDGTFTISHVSAGRTWLEAARRGLVGAPIEVTVAPGMDPVELRVGEGAAVWVHLKTADGAPATGSLMATRWREARPHPAARRELRATDEDGKAGFRLTTGLWRFSLRTRTGEAPAEVPLGEFSVVEGKTHAFDLLLPPR